MKYAARAMDFMGELGLPTPRAGFLEHLAEAHSNNKKHGSGADIFRTLVEPTRVMPPRIAASLAISSLVDKSEQDGEIADHAFTLSDFRQEQHGRLSLATGRLGLETISTGKQLDFVIAAIHFGDVDFYCALKDFAGEADFLEATETLWSQFHTGSVPSLLRLMEEEFGQYDFGLEHLLPEGRQRIYEIIFGRMVGRFSEQYEYLYEENRRNIEMLHQAGFHLPEELRAAAEFTITRRLERELDNFDQHNDPVALREGLRIAGEVARLGYRLDRTGMRRKFENLIIRTVRASINEPESSHHKTALTLISLAQKLSLHANFDRAQEIVYEALQADSKLGTNLTANMDELILKLGLAPRGSYEAAPAKEATGALLPESILS